MGCGDLKIGKLASVFLDRFEYTFLLQNNAFLFIKNFGSGISILPIRPVSSDAAR